VPCALDLRHWPLLRDIEELLCSELEVRPINNRWQEVANLQLSARKYVANFKLRTLAERLLERITRRICVGSNVTVPTRAAAARFSKSQQFRAMTLERVCPLDITAKESA
jgi:hypothetical protein